MPTPSAPSPADPPAGDPVSGRTGSHLRIAAHVGERRWNAAGAATARLLAGLDERGHAVRIYCSHGEVRNRVVAREILARRQELSPALAIHKGIRFARELRLREPDILLLTTPNTLWLGGWAARRAAVPRVVAWIGLDAEVPGRRTSRAALHSRIDTTVFPTAALRHKFLEAFPEYKGRAVTIPPGVARPALRGGLTLRAMLGVPLEAPLLGAIGELVQRNRHDRLIRLLVELPEAHGLVVGEGPARRALERQARNEGVADRFHLPGHQEDPGPVLDALDVFVGTRDSEGLDPTLLQAMAAGIPVVSWPFAGVREVLEPGAPGGVPPGLVVGPTVESAAAEMRTLLPDRRRLQTMGGEASQVARERFGESRMLDGWEAVLAP